MSYKIAVASSDSENINETFGSAKSFVIYEVSDGVCKKSEKRICTTEEKVAENNCNSKGCGNSDGCGSGCGGLGFHIQKQLERKAISAFDVSCTIDEALYKITAYYSRIDRHESLRK